jgi:hypothetical protein
LFALAAWNFFSLQALGRIENYVVEEAMLKSLYVCATTAALALGASNGHAMSINIGAGLKPALDATDVIQKTAVYIVEGRRYCFYFDGWHGAGWYRCGFALSFPKISSVQIRAMRQNQRIIRHDACDPSFAGNVRCRHVQAATQARSRESVSPPSAHHRLEAGAASSAAAWL